MSAAVQTSHQWPRRPRPVAFIYTAIPCALLMLLVSGCVSQPAVPQDFFYRLPLLHPDSPLAEKVVDGTAAVDQLEAEGVYRERPLLYVDAQRPLEVVQYHYRHWIKIPSQLIQDNLVDYLREANIADRVERYTGGQRPDLLIKGRLQKFERRVEETHATAVVEMEIEFRQKTPRGVRKITKVYSSEVPAQGSAIHDSVEAFGEALRQIYDTMLSDLNSLSKSPA
jgi:ABC-type uncharacterized transport system auxiliary subunit